jgi:hypothetical protein
VPSLPAGILALDSVTDICDWLGTYRERLRMARGDEHAGTLRAGMSARYHLGRAESA